MRRYDLTPLFRSAIGFDQFDRLFDAGRASQAGGFPPYNILKRDDDYRIVMAVAGFSEEDLELTVVDNTLVIAGKQAQEDETATYLHRGIAGRAFERRFALAENVNVTSAKLENGLLSVDLKREVPEHLKPRKIEISGATPQVESREAA
jgi:molecular chaperone IbpA